MDADSTTKDGFENIDSLMEAINYIQEQGTIDDNGGIYFKGLMGIGKTGDLDAFSVIKFISNLNWTVY